MNNDRFFHETYSNDQDCETHCKPSLSDPTGKKCEERNLDEDVHYDCMNDCESKATIEPLISVLILLLRSIHPVAANVTS